MYDLLKKADLFGLVVIAAALISYNVRGIWTGYQTAAIVAGAALFAASLILRFGEIRAGLRSRSGRFGINSATSVLLFVGVLGLVNYLGVRHQQRFDMTAERIHSLSEQSVQVAREAAEPVRIRAFYPAGDYPPARDLLNLYSHENSGITVEFIDPDRQPQLAQQYQVTSYGMAQGFAYGTVILEMAGRTQRIEKFSEPLTEQDVTNTLMRVIKGEQKTIYFTEGHGEREIGNAERDGYQAARDKLEQESYLVAPLNLIREGGVPEDAAAVVVAGPVSEPFPGEIEMLHAYLDTGGGVFLLLEPPPSASWEELTSRWSVEAGNNFVVDASGVGRLLGLGPVAPLVTDYAAHRITDRFNLMTVFPSARSMVASGAVSPDIAVQELLSTGEYSWGESDLAATEAGFDPDVDLQGPVPLAVVATKDIGEDRRSRFVAFGDSDFASNAYFGLQGNGNLFMNVVSWLAQDDSFISIRPRDPADRPITMTEAQGKMVSYLAVLFLPGAILAAGISVWLKRRK